MEFQNVFKVKKEVSEEQFLRNVLIGLSNDEKSPSNILDAKFDEVSEFQTEILGISADIAVNYSGTIGYDRQETYYETESYYDASLGKRRTKQVEKTRTVTDWQAYNGVLNTNEGVYVSNIEYGDRDLDRLFSNALKQAKDESVVEEGTASVNPDAYKLAVSACELSARFEVHWPGDRQKDERYSFKTDVIDLLCYIVPCYKVFFEYNGENYMARGFAFGEPNETHVVPQADGNVESEEIIEKRRRLNVDKAKKLLKVKPLFIVISVIMSLVGFYGLVNLHERFGFSEICIPLGFTTMAIGIICAIAIKISVNKKVSEINSKAFDEKEKLSNIKLNNLIKMLDELHLPKLSDEEMNSISESNRYRFELSNEYV